MIWLAKKLGETDERLFAVSAWRETPHFTDAERAALAGLVLALANNIKVWNRLNTATRQVASP